MEGGVTAIIITFELGRHNSARHPRLLFGTPPGNMQLAFPELLEVLYDRGARYIFQGSSLEELHASPENLFISAKKIKLKLVMKE